VSGQVFSFQKSLHSLSLLAYITAFFVKTEKKKRKNPNVTQRGSPVPLACVFGPASTIASPLVSYFIHQLAHPHRIPAFREQTGI